LNVVLVPAKFTRRVSKSGVFASGGSANVNAEAGEVHEEPFVGLKNDPRHAEAAASIGVGGHIVNVNRLPCLHFAGFQSFVINEGIGLGGADSEGIDADRKEAKEGKIRLLVGRVDRIRVGKKSKAVAFAKLFEEGLGLNRGGIESAIPTLGKLLEGEGGAKALAEMKMPVAWGDAAFLPVHPKRVFFDSRPDLLGSQRESGSQTAGGARDVNTNEDAANVENDRAKLTTRHELFAPYLGGRS